MAKQFFEIHGLLTLDEGTKREREVWHPIVCVTSEQARDNIFRKLVLQPHYARQNGTDIYEDFRKVAPAPQEAAHVQKPRKAVFIQAPSEMPAATTAEAPKRRRRRRGGDRGENPRAGQDRAASGRTEAEAAGSRTRSRRRKRRS